MEITTEGYKNATETRMTQYVCRLTEGRKEAQVGL